MSTSTSARRRQIAIWALPIIVTLVWLVTVMAGNHWGRIAAVWQWSGFIMAMFLAGLRGIDDEMLKAA